MLSLALAAVYCSLMPQPALAPQEDLRPENLMHEPTGIIASFPDHPKRTPAKSGGTIGEVFESKGPDGSRFFLSVQHREKIRGSGETSEALADAVASSLKPQSKVYEGFFGRCPAKFYSGTYPDSGEKFYVWCVPIFDVVAMMGVAQVKDRPFPEKAANAFFDSLVLFVDGVYPLGPRNRVRSDMSTLAGAFTTPILEHQETAPLKAGDQKLLLFNLQEGNVSYQMLTLEPPPEKRKEGLEFKAVEKLRDDVSKDVGARIQKNRNLKIGPADAVEWELEKAGVHMRLRAFALGHALYLMQYAEKDGFDSDKARSFFDSFHPVFRDFR